MLLRLAELLGSGKSIGSSSASSSMRPLPFEAPEGREEGLVAAGSPCHLFITITQVKIGHERKEMS